MGTLYDVMGVRPDAGHDEVKRAYARQAFRHHPDRKGTVDPGTRQAAECRMRELNAAWEVLGDPASRSTYDRELRDAVATPVPPPVPRDPAPRCDPEPSEGPVPPTRISLPDTDRRGFWVGVGAILAILCCAVAALAFTAYAGGDSDDASGLLAGRRAGEWHEAGSSNRGSVAARVGSCVVFASVDGRIRPMLAECSMQGAYGIAQIVPLGRPCGIDEQSFDMQAESARLCLKTP